MADTKQASAEESRADKLTKRIDELIARNVKLGQEADKDTTTNAKARKLREERVAINRERDQLIRRRDALLSLGDLDEEQLAEVRSALNEEG